MKEYIHKILLIIAGWINVYKKVIARVIKICLILGIAYLVVILAIGIYFLKGMFDFGYGSGDYEEKKHYLKSDYLPILQSNQQYVAQKLKTDGLQAEWETGEDRYDDRYKLVLAVTENQIKYYFKSKGATGIVFEKTRVSELTGSIEGKYFYIEVLEIMENGKIAEIELGSGSGGIDRIACRYKMNNLDRPGFASTLFTSQEGNDKLMKSFMSNSDIEKLVQRSEELQEIIKSIDAE